ncbi:transcriptional regulator [bacterium]|nr:transcriptional regulator [bacterium]
MSENNDLIDAFVKIADTVEMKQFFDEIFTSNERKDLHLRWKLMKLLKSGVPQRKIAADLGISLCKITRGVKIIQDPDSVSNKLL